MKSRFLRRRIVDPVLDLLRQGITPEKIALSIALGIMLGVTPVIGSTTLLCLLAAVTFRLNAPAIQLVNFFVYPLQLVLLIPFMRMGEWIFGAPAAGISLPQIFHLIRAGVWRAVAVLWTETLHALMAWFAIGSVAALLIYVVLAPVLRRVGAGLRPEAA